MANTKKIQEAMRGNPTWWQTILLSLVCSLVTALFAWGLARRSQNTDSFAKKFDEKANINFVIEQDNQLRNEQKAHERADDKRWEMLFSDIADIKENQRLTNSKLMK